MRYRKLDENGDYSFGHGQQDFLSNSPETVRQAVLTRFRLWKGEWFANLASGTGYPDNVIGKSTPDLQELILRDRALGTQGVTEITSYTATVAPDTRKLSIQIGINTVYGQTTVG